MSNLVVIGYDDPFKAEEVRLKLRKMQKDYLIDLEDAVVAVKNEKGKVKLHQAVNLTAAGAVGGGFWGSLIGLIFLNPLLGAAVGAAAGAVSHRCRRRRQVHEGAGGNHDAGQLGAFCPGAQGHAGQGARRTRGIGRQGSQDLAFA